MKIIIHSNAPFVGTGYGSQTDLLSRQMAKDGHEVAIMPFFGLQGASLTGEAGIRLLAPLLDTWGNDAALYYHSFYKPDIYLTLMDIWVLHEKILGSVPVTAWIPIDHEPMPPAVAHHAKLCASRIAMSQFGQRMFEAEDMDSIYIPHSVDTSVYFPMYRDKAREEVNIDIDTFVVTIVAANKGVPSRKSFPEMLAAWKLFCDAHPHLKKLLYLHTVVNDAPYGMDIGVAMSFFELDPATVRIADREALLTGRYSPQQLNTLYNMSDVLFTAPRGEGFGIPVIEAQAAGTPAIVMDFTAQPELVKHGYIVPVVDDDRIYTEQNSQQVRPRISELVKALEWGLEMRGNTRLRKKVRKDMLEYDTERVYAKYWKPNLPLFAERSKQHGFTPVQDG